MNTLLFFLIASFWGGSFIAIKVAVGSVPPVMAATGRVGAALFLLAVVLPLAGKTLKIPKAIAWKVWLTGLFMIGIPFSLLFWGEKQITPGLAGILNGSVPLWTFIFSLIFLKQSEGFSFSKLIGLIFGISGLLLIFYPKLALQGNPNETLGAISVGFMAVSYAIGTILARLSSTSAVKPTLHAGLFHQLLAGFIFLLIVSLCFEDWSNWLMRFSTPRVIFAELYLGWISTALAFIFFYHLLHEWGTVRTSAVTYLVPMVAVILDFLFNKRIPTFFELAGTLTIFAGVILIQLSHFSWKPRV